MVSLSLAQIAQYRSSLASHPDALVALDMIEDCEGDIEDAAIALALQVGQEPNRSDQWLEGVAKRWRVLLCRADVRANLEANKLSEVMAAIVEDSTLPTKLATPVLIYVLETGLDEFCRPLTERFPGLS